MKSRLLATGIAILGFAIIDGQSANAADKYFHNGTSNGRWLDADNWDAFGCGETADPGLPGASHDVEICANLTAVVDNEDAVAKTVTLAAGTNGGTTRIDFTPLNAGKDALLRLGDGESEIMSTLNADSEIRLLTPAAGSRLARLEFRAADHIIDGTGLILGSYSDAKIEINGVKLTTNSGIVARGYMKITGSGEFVNGGKVEANNTGVGDLLLVDVSTLDDANAGANQWVVSSSANAHLRLAPTTQRDMQGEFSVTSGTIEIDTALTTSGRLDIDSGFFQVDAGDTTMGDSTHHLDFSGGEIVVASSVVFTHN